jgi:hypothetical protein
MTDNNDAVNQRLNQINTEGETAFGVDTWKQALGGVAHRMRNTDRLSSGSQPIKQTELLEKLSQAGAANQIMAMGLDGLLDAASNGDKAAEAAYTAWRDSQPRRKKRIDQAR